MKIRFIGHNYRYSAEQTVVGLLGEKCELCETPPEQGDFIETVLRVREKYATATAEFRSGGKIFKASARSFISECPDQYEQNRLEQHALKLALYKAIQQATGREYPWGALTGMRPSKLAKQLLEQGRSPSEAKRYLIRRYGVKPERCDLALSAAQYGISVKNQIRGNEISLYVSIPFCPSRCSYCSFVSHEIGRSAELIGPYLQQLLKEISLKGDLVRELGFEISSVYIGGGTPTSLSADQLDELMQALRRAFNLEEVREYTVEAGRPDTITREKLAALKRNGCDRIAVNPQSMRTDVLKRCGRSHTAEETLEAFRLAREVGFRCINMDTIAGLPGDSAEGFRDTISRLLLLAPENITIHTLALKKGSDFKSMGVQSGEQTEVVSMLDIGMELLYNNGYRPYYLYRQKYMAASLENTGWTRPGYESFYNISIMEELQTILSLGAGGVTKLVRIPTGDTPSPGGKISESGRDILRISNPKYPREYIGAVPDIERIRHFFRKGDRA